ncbi:MAG: 50S ribosomal protein L30 [Rhodothermales bacterium]|nr:50S ribosomal protein L30 [Rhodothermales bacterium]
MAKLKITQTKSQIGQHWKQKRTVKALGLGRIGKTNEVDDTPQVRGMIEKVRHLISVEETA